MGAEKRHFSLQCACRRQASTRRAFSASVRFISADGMPRNVASLSAVRTTSQGGLARPASFAKGESVSVSRRFSGRLL
jgi:hypothetical protein